MTANIKELAMRLAKEANGSVVGGEDGTDPQCWIGNMAFDAEGLETITRLAFKAGMEHAAHFCAAEAERPDLPAAHRDNSRYLAATFRTLARDI